MIEVKRFKRLGWGFVKRKNFFGRTNWSAEGSWPVDRRRSQTL